MATHRHRWMKSQRAGVNRDLTTEIKAFILAETLATSVFLAKEKGRKWCEILLVEM